MSKQLIWKGNKKQWNNFINLLEMRFSPQDSLEYVIDQLNSRSKNENKI